MSVFEDEWAIRNLAAEYTDAVNRRDGYAMAAVYAPDGVLEMGERRIVGMDKLLKGFRRNVEEQRECLFQMTHSSVVKVDGDTAEARFWFSEIRKPTGEPYDYGYGVYQDSLVPAPRGLALQHPAGGQPGALDAGGGRTGALPAAAVPGPGRNGRRRSFLSRDSLNGGRRGGSCRRARPRGRPPCR